MVPVLAGAAVSAPVDDAETTAAVFGAREGVEQISLSPDGTKVAYIAPSSGQGSILIVRGVGDGAKPQAIAAADGKPERLGRCGWVSGTRLVCVAYGITEVEGRKLPFSRQFAIDTDGKNLKLLSTRGNSYTRGTQLGGGSVIDWLPDEDGSVLVTRVYLPDDHVGSHLGSDREGLGVDRMDTRTAAVHSVESPKRSAVEYISDGHGTVRIMGLEDTSGPNEMMTGIVHYLYRRQGSRTWERLSDVNSQTHEGFDPYAVDRDRNSAYGLQKKDGRFALYSMALDGSGKETLLFARPDVDVDGVARIGRRRRVIGASYSTDVGQVEYFDPEVRQLAASLSRALAKQPDIRVLDSSLDERKLLIFAGSDNDPGAYYVLDRDKRELHVFLESRESLRGRALGSMKAINYTAADGTSIPAYLTLPPGKEDAKGLPAIVMPHGGPASRDEWGFDWLPQFFAARGYAVIQPEFRGSAGYGDAWFQRNGFRSWRTAIGDVTDAGRWLVKQGIADPAKLAIVGWSYGGYAALQSAVIAPDLFKAVVAIAPVTDLQMLEDESSGWTDETLVRSYVGTGPEVRDGSPAQNAARIKVPVLLVHGTQDANVNYNQSTAMAAKLKAAGGKVQLITFNGLDHQLEDSEARKKLLAESDAFLRAAVKP
jgi:acetyl esterase/lipase